VIDFINLKINPTQSFRCAYRGRVCVCYVSKKSNKDNKTVDYSEAKNSWERRNILYSMNLDTLTDQHIHGFTGQIQRSRKQN
jgi:hypothetical protein